MEFHPFSSPPPAFSISLHPIGDRHPLHSDGESQRYREEKITLYREQPENVVQFEPDTIPAQQEIYNWLAPISHQFADRHEIESEFSHLAPLAQTALGIQDDLLLMRRVDDGWRLVAASLCFPSSWRLSEKFGLPLEQIHTPVPHMAGQMGDRIRRIFDNLNPQTPLWRENWSIEGDDMLRHDQSIRELAPNYKADKLEGTVFIRSEYQTLHKLPKLQDILFTVKIMARSVPQLANTETGRAYLKQILAEIPKISEAGIGYKGLIGKRQRLCDIIQTALNEQS